MLIHLVLFSFLATTPRAPADADVVAWVPRLDQLSTVLPFFRQAGAHSVVLRPESWREETHPLLRVDVTSRESLAAAGLDPAGALTLSRRGDYSWSCVTLANAKTYAAACKERLQQLGEVFERAGVVGARDPLNRVLAAYAVRGTESCALTGHGLSVEKLLPELPRLLTKTASGEGFTAARALSGAAYFVRPSGPQTGALALSADQQTLTLDARAKGLPLGELAGAGPSPFAGLQPAGMMTLRLRVTTAQLPAVIEELARRTPGGDALGPAARQLAPALSGNLVLFVHSVRVAHGLRTPTARFFALHLALLAETTDPKLAASLVEALEPQRLHFREGTLEAGVRGNVVYLANDNAALELALAALPAAQGKQAHGGELVVDPAAWARGLAQVPLLEAVQSPELAGVLAASTELGPLLLGTQRVTGWLDPVGPGVQRARLTWVLKPPAGDAGAP